MFDELKDILSKKEEKEKKKTYTVKLSSRFILVALLMALSAVIFLGYQLFGNKDTEPEIISVSTLQEIINVSELSTFTAVYNGIVEVPNEKKPEKVDYYVSYEAQVYAGIKFDEIDFTISNEEKIVHVDLPEARINDINVDITSLDFIFNNNKVNTSAITQEAFIACEEDVQKESIQQKAIVELAQQNAIKVITALIEPVIGQLDSAYTLIIE